MLAEPSPSSFPSLAAVFGQGLIARVIALGHTEDRRAEIAFGWGLTQLAIEDQFVKALIALDIKKTMRPTDADIARQHIDGAVTILVWRGPPQGEAPSPKEIKAALVRLSENMQQIENDLSALMLARRADGNGTSQRGQSLEEIHHAILGAIAENILPPRLSRKYSLDDIADTMPATSNAPDSRGFTNEWNGGFASVARTVELLANTFESTEFAKSTRPIDPDFVSFIGKLGEIWELWTGKKPKSPDAGGNLPEDWRSGFAKFVVAVWPLTPDGSANPPIPPPSNKVIRAAWNRSALLRRRTAP